MTDDTCVPNMGHTHLLDMFQGCGCEVVHLTTSVLFNGAIFFPRRILISIQTSENLIDNSFLFHFGFLLLGFKIGTDYTDLHGFIFLAVTLGESRVIRAYKLFDTVGRDFLVDLDNHSLEGFARTTLSEVVSTVGNHILHALGPAY